MKSVLTLLVAGVFCVNPLIAQQNLNEYLPSDLPKQALPDDSVKKLRCAANAVKEAFNESDFEDLKITFIQKVENHQKKQFCPGLGRFEDHWDPWEFQATLRGRVYVGRVGDLDIHCRHYDHQKNSIRIEKVEKYHFSNGRRRISMEYVCTFVGYLINIWDDKQNHIRTFDFRD